MTSKLNQDREQSQVQDIAAFDTSSHRDFYAYYEQQSSGDVALRRFEAIKATLLRVLSQRQSQGQSQVQSLSMLKVADIGCGAGTQSRLWAQDGHQVHGADINQDLITLARTRATESGLKIDFDVASATALPWPDQSMDLCIAPELLEHVENWQGCLSEMVRVLKPGGALYISTSNRLCPKQEEFTLPLYSWYPGFVKRHVEHLARTSMPQLAAYATYPAVHWFTFYGLRDHLARQGLVCLDRFDMVDQNGRGRVLTAVLGVIRRTPVLRFLAHCATPYTVLVGFKS